MKGRHRFVDFGKSPFTVPSAAAEAYLPSLPGDHPDLAAMIVGVLSGDMLTVLVDVQSFQGTRQFMALELLKPGSPLEHTATMTLSQLAMGILSCDYS